MTRVVVSAKSAITRAGLEALLRADARFEVVGEGRRAADFIRVAIDVSADVILIDGADQELFSILAHSTHQIGSPAVVLLMHDPTRNEIRRALQSGIRVMLLQDSAPHEIAAAIEAAAAGLSVLSGELLDTLLPASAELSVGEDLPAGEPLTSRESEILALLAEGAGNKEIASRLHISEHTVKFHVSSVLAKLGAATRTEAVSRGYKEGLIVM